METETLKEIVKKLEGTRWFIIGGFAVEAYTNGQRKGHDIDLVLYEKDIALFAERLCTVAVRRQIDKGTFTVQDYGFETVFMGQNIEATNGYPKHRVSQNTFNKLFDMRIRKNYIGIDLFLAPVEELIVMKATSHRPKDIEDLKLLKNEKFNRAFLLRIAKDYGEEAKTLKNLADDGYAI